MTSSTSWTVTKDVASWIYTLNPNDPATLRNSTARGQWLAAWLDRWVQAMPPFAQPGRIDVSTDSGGDAEFSIADGKRMLELLDFVRAHADVWLVELDLELQVELCDAQGWYCAAFRGGHASLQVEQQQGVIDDVNLEQDTAVWVTIVIDTELYVPRTYAKDSDNQYLAEHNGPRLTDFLRRMESDLHANFLGVESLSYSDQAHRYGFCLTAD